MSTTDPSLKRLSFLETIKENGMTKELYERIANEFESIQYLASAAVLYLLKHFVEFNFTPIYVNEIKDYLKELNEELFIEYGRKFRECRGCQEVFGIETSAIKKYDFTVVKPREEPKTKSYDRPRNRSTKNRQIKRKAKNEAAERYKKKLSERNNKKRKRNELEDLIRKQDL